MKLEKGQEIVVYIADSPQRQIQGLSGTKPEDFQDNEAMLFPGNDDRMRTFWMPDTHFDLDIIYLDQHMRIINIQKDVPHYPSREPDHKIPRAKPVFARHVLEIKSSSSLRDQFSIGLKLNLNLSSAHQ